MRASRASSPAERQAVAMPTIPQVKLRCGMTLGRGAPKPVPRLTVIAPDAVAGAVHQPQIALGHGVALFRCFAVRNRSLALEVGIGEKRTQIVLRVGSRFIGRVLQVRRSRTTRRTEQSGEPWLSEHLPR